ncbi:MAG: hypothetical protein KF726_04045 [Anaerolineae bacterium]|nr:hypothetical protein [Anaerolineae bacterium]
MSDSSSPHQIIIVISILALALEYAVGLYAIRRRETPGATWLAFTMFFAALWTLCGMMELGTDVFATKLFWFNLKQLAVCAVPLAIFFLALEYTGKTRWLHGWRFALICLIPAITQFLIWTGDPLHLLRQSVTMISVNDLTILSTKRGPWFWVSVPYLHTLMVSAFFLFLAYSRRMSRNYRGQPIIFALAIVGTELCLLREMVIYSTLVIPSPIFFLIPFLLIVWGLLRYRLFDVVPIARDLVIDQMVTGIVIIDPRGRILDLNPAAERLLAMLSRKPEPAVEPRKAIGTAVQAAFPLWSEWEEHGKPESPHEFEIRHGGVYYCYDVYVTPLNHATKSIYGKLLVLRDVTLRKLSQSHAVELTLEREKMRLLEQFLQNASHDLRTPLAVVKTALYTMKDLTRRVDQQIDHFSSPDPGEVRNAAHEIKLLASRQGDKLVRIENSVDRLAYIVESLLEITRLESEAQEPIITEPGDLNEIVEEAFINVQADAARKNITVRFQPHADAVPVMLHTSKLGLAVSKLVDNAVRYTQTGGSVQLHVSTAGNQAVIDIEDTGVGISPEDEPHIFERFYRGDKARSSATGGTGLGLPIAKSIVQAHGGRIDFASMEKHGSCFSIYLPLIATSELARVEVKIPAPL